MEVVVQKYGGTSVGQADRMLNVTNIVKQTLENGEKPVVVLSAMSGRVKAEGTTSRLVEAAEEALKGGSYYRVIDLLEEHHLDVVRDAIKGEKTRSLVESEIKAELKQLKSFLDAIQVIGEISDRSNDVIIGTGEKLSARILSGVLQDNGVQAEYINLEAVVEKGKFKEVNKDFCAYLQKKLAEIIKNCGSRIPVVTGYFGLVPNGILNGIGRGYTDFTAALIAAGIQAKELQIWKEVDGIFSADPNKVEKAKVLDVISPSEALELTYFGSEVIHPFTMEQVMDAKIPVRIKNTFNPSIPGTIIDPYAKDTPGRARGTAVTVQRDATLINIKSFRMLMAYGFMSKVFNVFNKYEIAIDLISTSEVNISMTVNSPKNLDAAIKELETLGEVNVDPHIVTVSLVGRGMKEHPGIASEMFKRLADEDINIEIISQGASEINISCAVKDTDANKALLAVHRMLEEN